MKTTSIRIVARPAADPQFRTFAQRHADDGVDTPEEMEQRLRARYPRARVVRGITDNRVERWYAYRDGSWFGRHER